MPAGQYHYDLDQLSGLEGRLNGQHTQNFQSWANGQKTDVANSEAYGQDPGLASWRAEHANFIQQTVSKQQSMNAQLAKYISDKRSGAEQVGQISQQIS